MDTIALSSFHFSQVSYTPIVGMFLNWPPALRALLASIWMFGIMPPKVKDYQMMLTPVVEQFAKYAPGEDGKDMMVWAPKNHAETHRSRDHHQRHPGHPLRDVR